MIETTLYQLLSTDDNLSSLTDGRIYPSEAVVNAQVPFAVYTVTGAEPQLTTAGPSGITKYTVEIETWALTQSDVLTILSAVKSILHGYTGGEIEGAFLIDQHTEAEEPPSYYGTQSFTVWASEAVVTRLATSAAKISSGENVIRLLPDGINPGIVITPDSITICGTLLDCEGNPLSVGGGSGDKTFTHTQSTPATSWTITHNLGKYPSVNVIDSGGNTVQGDVTYLDLNTVRINFGVSFGGTAFAN